MLQEKHEGTVPEHGLGDAQWAQRAPYHAVGFADVLQWYRTAAQPSGCPARGIHRDGVHPEHVHPHCASLGGWVGMVFVGQHKLVPFPSLPQAPRAVNRQCRSVWVPSCMAGIKLIHLLCSAWVSVVLWKERSLTWCLCLWFWIEPPL